MFGFCACTLRLSPPAAAPAVPTAPRDAPRQSRDASAATQRDAQPAPLAPATAATRRHKRKGARKSLLNLNKADETQKQQLRGARCARDAPAAQPAASEWTEDGALSDAASVDGATTSRSLPPAAASPAPHRRAPPLSPLAAECGESCGC